LQNETLSEPLQNNAKGNKIPQKNRSLLLYIVELSTLVKVDIKVTVINASLS